MPSAAPRPTPRMHGTQLVTPRSDRARPRPTVTFHRRVRLRVARPGDRAAASCASGRPDNRRATGQVAASRAVPRSSRAAKSRAYGRARGKINAATHRAQARRAAPRRARARRLRPRWRWPKIDNPTSTVCPSMRYHAALRLATGPTVTPFAMALEGKKQRRQPKGAQLLRPTTTLFRQTPSF